MRYNGRLKGKLDAFMQLSEQLYCCLDDGCLQRYVTIVHAICLMSECFVGAYRGLRMLRLSRLFDDKRNAGDHAGYRYDGENAGKTHLVTCQFRDKK